MAPVKSIRLLFPLLFPLLASAETAPRISQVLRVHDSDGTWIAKDADGDGDLDILSLSDHGEEPTWTENLGGRSFSNPRVIYYPDGDYEQIVGDLNGDGIVDLLTFSRNPEEIDSTIPLVVSVLILNRDLKPVARHTLNVGGDRWGIIDLDGDGRSEILQMVKSQDDSGILKIWNLQEDGTLSLWTSPIVISPLADVRHAVVVDADGDGDLDLHVGNYLLERTGNQTFSETIHDTDIPTYSENGRLSKWVDMDGDGLPDLVRIDNYFTQWLKNDGQFSYSWRDLPDDRGTLVDAITHPGEKAELIFATSRPEPENGDDWDGNEYDCFTRYRHGSDEPLAPSPVHFVSSQFHVFESEGELYADFDGDGLVDVLLKNRIIPSSKYFGIYFTYSWQGILWGEGGSFNTGDFITAAPLPENYASHPLDYDGDGDRDIIVGPNIAGQYELLANDGKGAFSRVRYLDELLPTSLKSFGAEVYSIIVGDVNADGKPDLLINFARPVGFENEFISAFELGNGDGTFNAPVLPEGAFDYLSAKLPCDGLFDWDGDGDLDATRLGAWQENDNGVLKSGVIPLISGATAADIFGSPQIIAHFVRGDLDGDGRADIISSVFELEYNQYGIIETSTMGIGFSGENGLIDEVATVPVQLAAPDLLGNISVNGFCLIQDLNNDGLNDLVYGELEGTDIAGNPLIAVKWKRNPGYGSRNPANWVTITLPTAGIYFGDFNGDGRPDWAHEKGFVTPTPQGPLVSPDYHFTGDSQLDYNGLVDIADYDGDGDGDLLAKMNGELVLVRNLIIDERSGVAARLRTLGVLGKSANPDEDADGDGRDNATELLEGTDPMVVDSANPEKAKPSLSLADGDVTVSYLSRTDAKELDLSYVLESSTDLIHWVAIPMEDATRQGLSGSWEKLSIPLGEKMEREFFRVKTNHSIATE